MFWIIYCELTVFIRLCCVDDVESKAVLTGHLQMQDEWAIKWRATLHHLITPKTKRRPCYIAHPCAWFSQNKH